MDVLFENNAASKGMNLDCLEHLKDKGTKKSYYQFAAQIDKVY